MEREIKNNEILNNKKNESEVRFIKSFKRSIVVGFAMICDIIINYPLWVIAKRIGAHLNPIPKNITVFYKVKELFLLLLSSVFCCCFCSSFFFFVIILII